MFYDVLFIVQTENAVTQLKQLLFDNKYVNPEYITEEQYIRLLTVYSLDSNNYQVLINNVFLVFFFVGKQNKFIHKILL